MEVRRYESVVVFNPRLSDSQIKEEVKKVEALLAAQNAKVSTVDTWGKKEAAFSFGKQKFGYYVVFNYETANHQAANELQSVLRINESVQKFQTHLIHTKVRKFKGNPKRLQNPRTDGDDFDFGGDSYE
jgi:small subunit ribosomal protein S6